MKEKANEDELKHLFNWKSHRWDVDEVEVADPELESDVEQGMGNTEALHPGGTRCPMS